MADVYVNIKGNSDQLKRELQDISNSELNTDRTASGSKNSMPNNTNQDSLDLINRITSDVFSKFQSQMTSGGTLDNRFIEELKRQKIREAEDDIRKKYDSKRNDIKDESEKKYDDIDSQIEKQRKEMISQMGNPNDPLAIQILEKRLEDLRGTEYNKVIKNSEQENAKLSDEEREENKNIEKDLTEALRTLADEYKDTLKDSGDKSDSYISKLRSERRQLMEERDSSDDRETALQKQREIESINEKLRPFNNETTTDKNGDYDKYALKILGLGTGFGNSIRSLGEGNIGGAISGTGMAVSSAIGGKAGMIGAGVTGILGSIWELVELFSGADSKLREFTRIRGVSGGVGGTAGYGYLKQTLDEGAYGLNNKDIGLDREEFMNIAQQSISKRGTTQDWYKEAMGQYALERTLNLNQNSLVDAGAMDRYGKNVTDAITEMVNMLGGITQSGRNNTGVSFTDFSRTQEKYDIQQSIMKSYLGLTDKPNYDSANSLLGALSSVRGITQDSRLSGDAQALQSMVRNPINDRVNAMRYDVAASIFPEAEGNIAKLDLMMTNPKNENRMIKAMIDRVSKQYGEVDPNKGGTTGYFAMKSLLGSIAPDRMIDITKDINGGLAGDFLNKGYQTGGYANMGVDKQTYVKQSTDLINAVNELKVEVIDSIKSSALMKLLGISNKVK